MKALVGLVDVWFPDSPILMLVTQVWGRVAGVVMVMFVWPLLLAGLVWQLKDPADREESLAVFRWLGAIVLGFVLLLSANYAFLLSAGWA